jgi:hypothetical protein
MKKMIELSSIQTIVGKWPLPHRSVSVPTKGTNAELRDALLAEATRQYPGWEKDGWVLGTGSKTNSATCVAHLRKWEPRP